MLEQSISPPENRQSGKKSSKVSLRTTENSDTASEWGRNDEQRFETAVLRVGVDLVHQRRGVIDPTSKRASDCRPPSASARIMRRKEDQDLLLGANWRLFRLACSIDAAMFGRARHPFSFPLHQRKGEKEHTARDGRRAQMTGT